jgi:hypothetical protein
MARLSRWARIAVPHGCRAFATSLMDPAAKGRQRLLAPLSPLTTHHFSQGALLLGVWEYWPRTGNLIDSYKNRYLWTGRAQFGSVKRGLFCAGSVQNSPNIGFSGAFLAQLRGLIVSVSALQIVKQRALWCIVHATRSGADSQR